MEQLVGVLHHSHRHASRYIDALSLQGGSRVGDQFGLEGRVTPCLGDDLAEFWIIKESDVRPGGIICIRWNRLSVFSTTTTDLPPDFTTTRIPLLTPCHRIERFFRKLIGGHWRQHQMELLVGVLQHSHRHASRYIDALSLQGGSRVGDQFGLEGRVTPSLSDDLTEFWIIFSHRSL